MNLEMQRIFNEINDRIENLEAGMASQRVVAGASGGGGMQQAIPEMFPTDLWTFAQWKDLISDAISWAWDEISKTAANIWDVLQNLAGGWATMADAVTGFGKMGFALLTGTMAELRTAISDTISWAWDEISRTAANIWDVLQNLVGGWDTMANAVSGFGKMGFALLTGTMAELRTAISDTISWAWDEISRTAANIWDVLKNLSGGWDTMADAVSGFGKMGFALLTGTMAELRTAISDTISWAWDEISRTAANIWDVLQNLAGGWDTMADAVTGFGKFAFTLIEGTFNEFKGAITDTIQWAWTEISGTFQDFKNAITDTISWAWGEISKTYVDVLNTIGSWANIAAELGGYTWNWFWNNLLTGGLLAINAGGNISTNAINSVAMMVANVFTATSAALNKFADDFWAADATGRGKFAAGVIIDSLVSAQGILAGKILVGASTFLNAFFDDYQGVDPRIYNTKLQFEPYKLTTTAYNYVVNGSFEHGTWGGSDEISTSEKQIGNQSSRLHATGSNIYSGYSNFIDIRGYDEVTISVWMRVASRTSGTAGLRCYFYNSAKTYISYDTFYSRTSNQGWGLRTETYQLPSGVPANTAYIRLRWAAYSSPNMYFYTDGWSVNFGNQIPDFQDFTAYSYNWSPDKIDTIATSSVGWSEVNWSDPMLSLNFTCDSKMLLLIYTNLNISHSGSYHAQFRVQLDGVTLDDNYDVWGDVINLNQSAHIVKIADKGSHTLTLQIRKLTGTTVYVGIRRLTILSGFYQGGAT